MIVSSLWARDDVQEAAERIGLHMNAADAEEFLRQNEGRLMERLSECGCEILEGMLEHERYLKARAQYKSLIQAKIGKED